MGAALQIAFEESIQDCLQSKLSTVTKSTQLIEISGVFKGRELTRKDRRLAANLAPADLLLGGGIARGRISELIGRFTSGKTSTAAAFAASASQRGEVIAWVDSSGAFDPASMAAAGVELSRVLWIHACAPAAEPWRARRHDATNRILRAGEMVLEAGGFGLVVLDFGADARMLTNSAALRIARMAERSGASVLILTERSIFGTFAALSLTLSTGHPLFSARSAMRRTNAVSPSAMLLDGLVIEARVARNKLGAGTHVGAHARWHALIDFTQAPPAPAIDSDHIRVEPELIRSAL